MPRQWLPSPLTLVRLTLTTLFSRWVVYTARVILLATVVVPIVVLVLPLTANGLRPRTSIVRDPGHPPRALIMFPLTVLELTRWNGFIGIGLLNLLFTTARLYGTPRFAVVYVAVHAERARIMLHMLGTPWQTHVRDVALDEGVLVLLIMPLLRLYIITSDGARHLQCRFDGPTITRLVERRCRDIPFVAYIIKPYPTSR